MLVERRVAAAVQLDSTGDAAVDPAGVAWVACDRRRLDQRGGADVTGVPATETGMGGPVAVTGGETLPMQVGAGASGVRVGAPLRLVAQHDRHDQPDTERENEHEQGIDGQDQFAP